MKTYLVTGAAGFIGANFIKHMLAKYDDIKIVVLDLLTYAGNLGTIDILGDGAQITCVSQVIWAPSPRISMEYVASS